MPVSEKEIKEAYKEIRKITGLKFDETNRDQVEKALSQIYIDGHNLWYGMKNWPRLGNVNSGQIITVRNALRRAQDVNNTSFICIMKPDDRLAVPRMIPYEKPLDRNGKKLSKNEAVMEKLRQKQQAAREYAESFEEKRESHLQEVRKTYFDPYVGERGNLEDPRQYFEENLFGEGMQFLSREKLKERDAFVELMNVSGNARYLTSLCNILMLGRGYSIKQLCSDSEEIRREKKKVGQEIIELIKETDTPDGNASQDKKFEEIIGEAVKYVNTMQAQRVDFSDESTLDNIIENNIKARMLGDIFFITDNYRGEASKIKEYNERFRKMSGYMRNINSFDYRRAEDPKKEMENMANVWGYQKLIDHFGPDYNSYRTAPLEEIANGDYPGYRDRLLYDIIGKESGLSGHYLSGTEYGDAYEKYQETGKSEDYEKLIQKQIESGEKKDYVDQWGNCIRRIAEARKLDPIEELPEEVEQEVEEKETREEVKQEAEEEEMDVQGIDPREEKAAVYGWIEDEDPKNYDSYRQRLQNLYDQIDSHDPLFLSSSAEYKAVKSGLKDALKQMDKIKELQNKKTVDETKLSEAKEKFNKAMSMVYQNSETYLHKKEKASIGKNYGQERLEAIRKVRETLYGQGHGMSEEKVFKMFRTGAAYNLESDMQKQLAGENGFIRLGIYMQNAKDTGNKADMRLLDQVITEKGKNSKHLLQLREKMKKLDAKLPAQEQVEERVEGMKRTKELICKMVSAQKGMTSEMLGWSEVLEGFQNVAGTSELGQLKEIANDIKSNKMIITGEIGRRAEQVRWSLQNENGSKALNAETAGVIVGRDTIGELMQHKDKNAEDIKNDKKIFHKLMEDKQSAEDVVQYFGNTKTAKEILGGGDWQSHHKMTELFDEKTIGTKGKKEVVEDMLKQKQQEQTQKTVQKQNSVKLP